MADAELVIAVVGFAGAVSMLGLSWIFDNQGR